MSHSSLAEADGISTAAEPAAADLLLALPTLAQAAFWVIVVTFAGILLASLIGGAPIRMEPIVLSLLLLPARAVLAYPDKQRAAREDSAATQRLKENGAYDRIVAELDRIATEAYQLKRPVGLIIGRDPHGIQAVCSWRRDYLIVGYRTAQKLANALAGDCSGEVRALFLHELAHMANRDHQRVGFAGELLRGSMTILPWWILFITFWVGMALQGIAAVVALDFTTVPDIPPDLGQMMNDLLLPDAAARAEMLARAESINLGSLLLFVFLSFLPIALTGGILYLFFWRWMVRLQEHYADVAARQRGATQDDLNAARPYGLPINLRKTGLWGMLNDQPWRRRKSYLHPKPTSRNWFSLHPTWPERKAVFAAPELLYTDWKRVAWSTAILSVGLDVVLSSPLFAYHGLTLHLYMATTFLMLSTWLLPQLAIRRPVGRDLGRALLIIIAVRAVWLALNVGLLVVQVILFPARAMVLLNAIVIAGSRYTGDLTSLPILDPLDGLAASLGAVLLEVLQMGGLIAAVAIYVWWMRRYAGAAPAMIRVRHWIAVAVIILIVYSLMWPVANLI